MNTELVQAKSGGGDSIGWVRSLYRALAPRAYSVLIYTALVSTLGVKFYHALYYGLVREYPGWILTDIAVLVSIDLILTLACHHWPTKWILRTAALVGLVVCIWSVMNAGWVVGTGMQILPMELLPLFRDPADILDLIGKRIRTAPVAATLVLFPGAAALAFFVSLLVKPIKPVFGQKTLAIRITASLSVVVVALLGLAASRTLGSPHAAAAGIQFNSQARAVLSFILPRYRHVVRADFANATRQIPRADEITLAHDPQAPRKNVVIVILESVQYGATSLATNHAGEAGSTWKAGEGPTPYLRTLADQGAQFTQMRSVVTHTTKAIFSLMTGRTPSAFQDIAEAIPVETPYASLATILHDTMGYRTAFFQSAKGTFEGRPGLIHNLGFDEFRAREDLAEPEHFLGYLACDEFAMIGPATEWIQSAPEPFLLVLLCSATHDPYEVPSWYGDMAPTPAQRYEQTVTYTDRYIEALDRELGKLDLTDDTIFCVVGDHAEAFGEHHIQGHERLAYEEVLHIPFVLRAPSLITPGTRVDELVCSKDITPTILNLLGFDSDRMGFEGLNALAPLPADRKLFFSGWMQQGPGGFIQGDSKFIYDPEQGIVSMFSLDTDPLELNGLELPEPSAQRVSDEVVEWRKSTIFKINEDEDSGERILYGRWLCKWNGRIGNAKRVDGP